MKDTGITQENWGLRGSCRQWKWQDCRPRPHTRPPTPCTDSTSIPQTPLPVVAVHPTLQVRKPGQDTSLSSLQEAICKWLSQASNPRVYPPKGAPHSGEREPGGHISQRIKERVEKTSLCGWSPEESALGTEGLGHHTSLSVEHGVERARIPVVLQHFLQGLTFLIGPCDTLTLHRSITFCLFLLQDSRVAKDTCVVLFVSYALGIEHRVSEAMNVC